MYFTQEQQEFIRLIVRAEVDEALKREERGRLAVTQLRKDMNELLDRLEVIEQTVRRQDIELEHRYDEVRGIMRDVLDSTEEVPDSRRRIEALELAVELLKRRR